MSEERWDCPETFVAVCRTINAINEAKAELGHKHIIIMILEDINTLQDLLREQGFAIQKIKS
jgi:hypothetical protein